MGKLVIQQVQADATSPVLTLPTTAPTAGNLLTSDVSGNLNFTDVLPASETATNITASGTISANALAATTNVNAGTLQAPNIKASSSATNFVWPTVDGTAGQVIQTNGSGVLSLQNLSPGIVATTDPTSSTAAAPGIVYVNTYTNVYYVCLGTRTISGVTNYVWQGSNGTIIGYPQGQAAYTTPGTYSWTAPAGVTSVCVVCVGGGGGGNYSWSSSAGSGGGLGWKNNIPVVPGDSYTVVVGAGGSLGSTNATAGGNSYFISLATVSGYGGGNAGSGASTGGPHSNSYGGGWVGDNGGAGGNAPNYQGGGGAGGYTGNGGNGGSSAGNAGNGGGGGSGGYYSSTYGTAAGGGVGLLGQGESGAAGNNLGTGFGGGGGSGGANGVDGEPANNPYVINGGAYGGGAGGSGTSYGGGTGGSGAVRIIWGFNRAFPTTNTGNVI